MARKTARTSTASNSRETAADTDDVNAAIRRAITGTEIISVGVLNLVRTTLITALAGALMVSRFSFPSFKQFDLDRRIKFVYALLVPLFFVLIAIEPSTMLLAMFSTYALSAPVMWVARRLRRVFRGAPATGVR